MGSLLQSHPEALSAADASQDTMDATDEATTAPTTVAEDGL